MKIPSSGNNVFDPSAIESEGHPTGYLYFALAVVFCLAIYSDAFPYRYPVFLPLVCLVFGWFGVLRKRFVIPLNGGFAMFFGCFLFYLLGVLHDSQLYKENAKDLLNACGVLLLVPLLFSLRGKYEFLLFRNSTLTISSFLSTWIAVTSLVKYQLLGRGIQVETFWIEGYPYPWGSSLVIDYNFFAFAMLAGSISSLYCFRRSSVLLGKLWYFGSFVVSAFSMALAGSRRGWVTEALFLSVLLVIGVASSLAFLLRIRDKIVITRNAFNGALSALTLTIVSLAVVVWYSPNLLSEERGFHLQVEGFRDRYESFSDPDMGFGQRTVRWRFATELIGESSPMELFFGQGFGYLHRYANRFQMLATREDYPHNPILSATLYSGLVGGLWVTSFMILAVAKYYKYRKTDSYFFALYFASLFYVLPSFQSFISGKFFGLFLLMPWLLQQSGPNTAASTHTSVYNTPRTRGSKLEVQWRQLTSSETP
jgi:hypothetical protein